MLRLNKTFKNHFIACVYPNVTRYKFYFFKSHHLNVLQAKNKKNFGFFANPRGLDFS